MKKLLISTILIILLTVSLSAHFTWIRVDNGKIAKGKPVHLKISHGHDFPSAGSSLPASSIKAYLKDPAGKIKKIEKVKREKGYNSAKFIPESEGAYVFYFIYGPIIRSKTTRGWKTGGPDKYPKARDSFQKYETSAAYAKTEGSDWNNFKPLGLKYELSPIKIGDKIEMILLLDGKPISGIEIEMTTISGSKSVGKTDKKGIFKYKPVNGFKGEILFSAEVRNKALKGANYKKELYITTMLIDMRQ